jgi:CubicO group peptidase (beta-lactamase class C family)
LLIALIFFFIKVNSSSGNTQFEISNNLSTSPISNEFNSNFSRQIDANDFILKTVYEYPLEKMHNYTSKLSQKYGFNGSILVAKNGKILFEEHIGYKNLRHKDSIESTSTYQLASVSGLPNYMYAAEHNWKSKTPPDNTAMLSLMNKVKMQAYFTPGSRFDYSNTGYFVLASIVSKVTNQSLGDFLDSRFFKPLNLTHTYVYNPNQETKKEELIGFRRYGKSYIAIPSSINDGVVGDKGVYSTVSDLFKWNQSLTEHTILNDTILAKAFRPGKTNSGKMVPYGFGFRLKQETDSELVYHNGVWNGFSTTLRRYKADNITIIILSNNSFHSITPVSEELYELSKDFSKYDLFVSFLENTNIYDLHKLKNDLLNFTDIPRAESVSIIEKIANIYNKQNAQFISHKYLEVSSPNQVNQQYQVLFN